MEGKTISFTEEALNKELLSIYHCITGMVHYSLDHYDDKWKFGQLVKTANQSIYRLLELNSSAELKLLDADELWKAWQVIKEKNKGKQDEQA